MMQELDSNGRPMRMLGPGVELDPHKWCRLAEPFEPPAVSELVANAAWDQAISLGIFYVLLILCWRVWRLCLDDGSRAINKNSGS